MRVIHDIDSIFVFRRLIFGQMKILVSTMRMLLLFIITTGSITNHHMPAIATIHYNCNISTNVDVNIPEQYQQSVQPWKLLWLLSWQLPAASPAALRNELLSQLIPQLVINTRGYKRQIDNLHNQTTKTKRSKRKHVHVPKQESCWWKKFHTEKNAFYNWTIKNFFGRFFACHIVYSVFCMT